MMMGQPGQHLEQGISINKLWNKSDELRAAAMSPERLRLLARRAADAGELNVKMVNRTRGGTGKGRSKRISLLIATITAAQRTALKENGTRSAVTRVRAHYEAHNPNFAVTN